MMITFPRPDGHIGASMMPYVKFVRCIHPQQRSGPGPFLVWSEYWRSQRAVSTVERMERSDRKEPESLGCSGVIKSLTWGMSVVVCVVCVKEEESSSHSCLPFYPQLSPEEREVGCMKSLGSAKKPDPVRH